MSRSDALWELSRGQKKKIKYGFKYSVAVLEFQVGDAQGDFRCDEVLPACVAGLTEAPRQQEQAPLQYKFTLITAK